MRTLSFAAFCLVCCQPIVIGTPSGSGGDGATDGTGGKQAGTSAGGSLNNGGSVAVLPTGGASTAGDTGTSGSHAGAGGDGAGAGIDAGASGAGAGGSSELDDAGVPSLTARVLLVAYDPTVNGAGEPDKTLTQSLALDPPNVLAEQLAARLETATTGHVHYVFSAPQTRLVFPPTENGIRYSAASYAACLANPSNCSSAPADYAAIDDEINLCSAVRNKPYDQIWLLGGKHFGFSVGKQLFCEVEENNGPVTKQIDVVTLDYSEGLTSLLASYQQHSQFALTEAFGIPAAISTADSPNNTYGLFVQAQGRAFAAPASGCGDITFAPNSLSPNRFDDPRSAPSYCETFLRSPRPAPLSSLSPITCAAWGCTELGFRDYWFAHLPSAPWSDSHDHLNDFWPYILHASVRATPPAVSVTCSSSYERGWCGNTLDGDTGVCNENEWALLEGSTGFVELRFVPPKLISNVSVFDRACVEQVLAGHLEFSDGSAPIGFGQLPDDGLSPVTRSFPPKLLSGLRVVIDVSTGPHPGFAEISLSSD